MITARELLFVTFCAVGMWLVARFLDDLRRDRARRGRIPLDIAPALDRRAREIETERAILDVEADVIRRYREQESRN